MSLCRTCDLCRFRVAGQCATARTMISASAASARAMYSCVRLNINIGTSIPGKGNRGATAAVSKGCVAYAELHIAAAAPAGFAWSKL
jgi:hypothetical protein